MESLVKLRHKLLAGLLLTAVLTAALVGGATFQLVRHAVEERSLERLDREARLLADWLSSLPVTAEQDAVVADATSALNPALQDMAEIWGQALHLRVTLIDAAGVVRADSRMGAAGVPLMDNHADRPEVVDAGRDGKGRAFRTSDSTGETFLYLARKVSEGHEVATLRLALPAREIRRTQLGYFWLALGMAFVALLVMGLFGYAGVRLLSRPVEHIAAGAERIAGGDFDHTLETGGTNEIGRLSAALAKMRGALLGKIDELERKQALFDSVVTSMHEGVLVVDAKQRVRIANDALEQICHVPADPAGRLLAEVVRLPELIQLVENALETGKEQRQTIQALTGTDAVFEARVTALHSLREPSRIIGVVALLLDVTRLEALETTRKEFVANVSHELRTPLTSIKAAATTLLEDGCCDRQACERFLGTIVHNSERMSLLISDLTDLSQIETGSVALDIRSVEIAPLVQDVVSQLEPRFTELGLHTLVDIPEGHTLNVDRRRFEQVLVNLIDNAMKFNREGGEVHVRCSGNTLVVEDTGAGIPDSARDKVFQRFYRVDAARSRLRGGTGLGLAIVKHLIVLHGGSITLDSELGRGSRFTIELG